MAAVRGPAQRGFNCEARTRIEAKETNGAQTYGGRCSRASSPVQVASIEAFSHIGLPLCITDLAEIIDDIEAVHLDYHLGRLLKIGALELADSRYAQKEFMEMRYRLSEEGILSGGR